MRKNRRTKDFKERFDALPLSVQKAAIAAFRRFCEDPSYSALRHHKLDNTDKGQHKNDSWSVSFSSGYRAIYVIEGDFNVWYWTGTHAEYDTFTGK